MMNQLAKGCYHDVLTDSQGRVQWEGGWRPNLIVQPCNVLLAALMKRHRRVRGILYRAVGEGEKDWDALCPSPRLTTTQLTTEIARQALSPDQIVYLDDAGEPMEPPSTPSNCLQVRAEFKGEDLVSNGFQPLREFGLFGGDATEAPDSGFMIDYVIHPRIDLTPEATLKRNVRLTFTTGIIEPEELAGFGAALPVSSIDGVGDAYASALGEGGIHSLGDLVEVDPLRPVGDIPPVKLREFQAKARLVMRLRASPASLELFADRNVSRFLRERPGDLAGPGVTPERVQRLQEALADLQIALGDAQLQRIMLGDLA
jgi:hypothetical protein